MITTLLAMLVMGAVAAADGDGPREAAVALARKTLAAKLSLRAETMQLDKAEAVDWPDTSLGCPEPGMMYAQMLTPGYRVFLKAEGKTHAVHVSGTRAVMCGADARKPARIEPKR